MHIIIIIIIIMIVIIIIIIICHGKNGLLACSKAKKKTKRERERENNLTHFFNYWHKVYVHTMSLVKRAWLPTTS